MCPSRLQSLRGDELGTTDSHICSYMHISIYLIYIYMVCDSAREEFRVEGLAQLRISVPWECGIPVKLQRPFSCRSL